jgi:hypothetical protein
MEGHYTKFAMNVSKKGELFQNLKVEFLCPVIRVRKTLLQGGLFHAESRRLKINVNNYTTNSENSVPHVLPNTPLSQYLTPALDNGLLYT